MKCQLAAGIHEEEREATILVVFPSGSRDPACEDCARYWINLRPYNTVLAPLEAQVDYYARAKTELAAWKAAQARPAARPAAPPSPPRAPQELTAPQEPDISQEEATKQAKSATGIYVGVLAGLLLLGYLMSVNPVIVGVLLGCAVLTLIIWVFCTAINSAAAQHRAWLAQHTRAAGADPQGRAGSCLGRNRSGGGRPAQVQPAGCAALQ